MGLSKRSNEKTWWKGKEIDLQDYIKRNAAYYIGLEQAPVGVLEVKVEGDPIYRLNDPPRIIKGTIEYYPLKYIGFLRSWLEFEVVEKKIKKEVLTHTSTYKGKKILLIKK